MAGEAIITSAYYRISKLFLQLHPLFAVAFFIHVHVFMRRGYRLYQFVFGVDEGAADVVGAGDTVAQEDRFFWACFFAEAAEDAAKHIDFVFGSIFFFAI